ncbi:MAG: glycosyltransferase family 2 protein [Nitrospirae bacterium]|nr:glycosyltransferase family 2 protein [Nitrospirota bacterium]
MNLLSKESPFVSVVFSFRNEEEVIPELIKRLRDVFEGELKENRIKGHELIFVNDDSTDHSLELLLEQDKGYGDIKVINMSRTFGVSVCVMAGLKYSKGDVVLYMDADLQDPPELIPALIEEWRKDDVDVVYTTRRTRKGEHPFKLWLTRLGYRILKTVSNIDIPANSGDFKLISRRAVNELIRLHEKKPFTRGLISWIGFKQRQVFYDRDPRYAGETKFPIYSWKVISNFLDSALISFSDVPLKLALLSGFVISSSAFLFLIWVFIQKFLGLALPGWSALAAIILVLGGIQLITIGVLGLYINSIFNETKKRPNYIVKDTYGFNDP